MASTGKYPTRPDAEDCSFFVRTGTCKFGSSCKFNHPVLTVDGDKSNGNGGGSSSKIPCKVHVDRNRYGYGFNCGRLNVPQMQPCMYDLTG
ncbi:putative transcription factor C3H family [Helianthus annuus]|nr:putative transcription factor C3H family [Helianthus annuus]